MFAGQNELRSSRPTVKFLTAIWGARFVEEFARVSLLSYLAPGNLPALAAATDVEITILTSQASQEAFDREPAVTKLKTIAPVRFIYIDDLITTGNYGVTLTLAYARGIAATGDQQTNTYFLFMNSDFVLAEGSLRNLAVKLQEGHPCIMAPSLRACAEPVLPILRNAVDVAAGQLSMSARAMVRLTLDYLHPTVIAKTVTQSFVTCSTHNQLYWQVDANTLLARNHLIFMLAIKPEVPLGRINSYCDYGLVPELVPSGRFTVIGDSDQFYMLELQPETQEANFLRCGVKSPEAIADELAVWTTREHRRFAEVDTVFHAADLPPALQAVKKEAASFVSAVHARMPAPVDHADHFYWALGVQAWMQLRTASAGEGLKLPPELVWGAPGTGSGDKKYESADRRKRRTLKDYYMYAMAFARRRVYGIKPIVPVWHHDWQDYRLLWQALQEARSDQSRRHLLIWDAQTWLPPALRDAKNIDACLGAHDYMYRSNAGSARNRLLRADTDESAYDSAIVYMLRRNVRDTRRVIESLPQHLKADAPIVVFIEHANSSDDSSNFSVELAQYVHSILPSTWMGYSVSGSFVGGRSKLRLAAYQRGISRALWPLTLKKTPKALAAALAFPVVSGLTAINNVMSRHASPSCPDWCSSAMLVIRPRAADKSSDPVVRPDAAARPLKEPGEAARHPLQP